MASFEQPNLPVINFSIKDLNHGSSSWVTTCNEVMHAMEEYGCFIATYDGVSQELHDEIFAASKELLDLPTEVKVLNAPDAAGHGYIGNSPKMPFFERLSIENATTVEGAETFTRLMWPSGNESFCDTALTFAKAVAELEQIVMRMVAKTYAIEQHYDVLLDSTTYIIKFNRYLSRPENETSLGLFPHTDKSFITTIHQKEQGKGLEIQTKNGEWIGVDLSPSSFIVMAGDVCMAWTNGRINAPFHRVMMQAAKKDRFSMVVSSYIRDLEVEVPEVLIDEDHPLKFKPFDHYKYIHYHTYEKDRTLDCAIKSYCGI